MQDNRKIKADIQEIISNYLGNGQMEEDFAALKPTERVRFLEKVLPYFISTQKKNKGKAEKPSRNLPLFQQAGITLRSPM